MYRGVSCSNPLAKFEQPEADGEDMEDQIASFELEEDSDDDEPLVDDALGAAIDAMEEETIPVCNMIACSYIDPCGCIILSMAMCGMGLH